MVMWPYYNTKQQTLAICGLFAGSVCIFVGAHFSYSNVAPQQARIQARNEYVKARLRKFLEE